MSCRMNERGGAAACGTTTAGVPACTVNVRGWGWGWAAAKRNANPWGQQGLRSCDDCQTGVLRGKAGNTELLAPADVSSACAASGPFPRGGDPFSHLPEDGRCRRRPGWGGVQSIAPRLFKGGASCMGVKLKGSVWQTQAKLLPLKTP